MTKPRLLQLAALLVVMIAPAGSLFAQGTLERIAKRNEFRIGFDPDARPLSFVENGQPAGYSVDICRRVAVGVKEHLKRPDIKVTYVPVSLDKRFDAVENGDIDIECGSTTITLGRQERVDFTLMTFVTGGTMLSMGDRHVARLEDLAGKRVAVISGTTTESALQERLSASLIDARVVKVADAEEGLRLLERGEVAAYASDQIVLIGDAQKAHQKDPNLNFSFADELFSFEPYGLMVQRNDADFRLVANRVIAQLFRSGQFAKLYDKWIGSIGIKPAPLLIAMYQVQSLPE